MANASVASEAGSAADSRTNSFEHTFSATFLNLPEELFTKHVAKYIFLEADIKPFRSVCRPWRDMIQLPHLKLKMSRFSEPSDVMAIFRAFGFIEATKIKSAPYVDLILDCLSDEKCKVRDLDLTHTVMSPAQLGRLGAVVSRSTTFRSLSIRAPSNLPRTTSFIDSLGPNKSLESMHLSGHLRPATMSALIDAIHRNFVNIQSLEYSNLGPQGVTALAKLISTTRTVHTFNCPHLSATDEGAEAMGRALALNKTLKNFVLHDAKLSSTALAAICSGLSQNKSITFCDLRLNKFNSQDMTAINRLIVETRTLKQLMISVKPKFFPTYCAAVASNQTFESFTVDHSHYLALEECEHVVRILKQNTSLNKVSLHLMKGAMTGLVDAISQSKTVRCFTVNILGGCGEDIQHLATSLLGNTSLQDLVVSDLWHMEAAGYDQLFSSLAAHPSISSFSFSFASALPRAAQDAFAQYLESTQILRYLSFYQSGVGSHVKAVILQGLAKNMSLNRVDFRYYPSTRSEIEQMRELFQRKGITFFSPDKAYDEISH